MGVFTTLVSLRWIVSTFIADIKSKRFIGIIAFTFIMFLLFYKTGVEHVINHESTQQAGAALMNIKEKDLHYTRLSFLGYPSRQYLITILPSIAFGQYPLTLNIGYIYPFILGLLVFYSGVHLAWNGSKNRTYYSTIAVLSVFLFNYTLPFALHFEQSILPLAFTLQATGFFLLTLKKPSLLHFISLIWAGSLLSGTYTPGMASWGLLIVGIMYISGAYFKRKLVILGNKWFVMIFPILTFGILSISKIHEASSLTRTDTAMMVHSRVLEALSILFSTHDTYAYVNPLFFFPFLFYFVTSLLGRHGFKHFAVVSWSLVVVIISVLAYGYANPPPSLSIHRSLVIIPPLLIGFLYWFDKLALKISHNMWMGICITICVMIPFMTPRSLLRLNNRDPRVGLVWQIISLRDQGIIDTNKKTSIMVYSMDSSTTSLGDMLQYFTPVNTLIVDSRCGEGYIHSRNSVIFTDQRSCMESLVREYEEDDMPLIATEQYIPEHFNSPLYRIVAK
jgi:hypothetical protein